MTTDAHTFSARPLGFAFGLTTESVAAGLRKLASDIEAGRLLPQAVTMSQNVKRDDFALTEWTLTFIAAEKR